MSRRFSVIACGIVRASVSSEIVIDRSASKALAEQEGRTGESGQAFGDEAAQDLAGLRDLVHWPALQGDSEFALEEFLEERLNQVSSLASHQATGVAGRRAGPG